MEVDRNHEASTLVHLDTVRALHQTVVSLRNALESSKAELQCLKDKYENIDSSKLLSETVEKLALENNLLKKKISDFEQPKKVDQINDNTIDIETKKQQHPLFNLNQEKCDKLIFCSNSEDETPITVIERKKKQKFQRKIDLHSKFDVKIKVRHNNSEGINCSDSSSSEGTVIVEENVDDTNDSSKGTYIVNLETSDNKIKVEHTSSENIEMAMPDGDPNDSDPYKIKVRIFSEENLVIDSDQNEKKDGDEASERFPEAKTSAVKETQLKNDPKRFEQESLTDESEEVDDIELIFTTDETKDMSNVQEDLVSIRDVDWSPLPNTSTPILVKFHTLDGDLEHDLQKDYLDDSLKIKRTSLPDVKKVSLDIINDYSEHSDNQIDKKVKYKSLDSTDSNAFSFDNPSFENSSMETIHRDESVDNFYQMKTFIERQSLLPQSDLTKCGVSQENIHSKLNARRYTTPNVLFFKQPTIVVPQCTNRQRDSSTQTRSPPPRWTSDGSLAHKIGVCSNQTTLPSKVYPPADKCLSSTKKSRLDLRHRTDESRRLLLSDIGFTSLVPELSRSAEPIWAIQENVTSPGDLQCCKSAKKATLLQSPSDGYKYSGSQFPHAAFCGSLPELRKPALNNSAIFMAKYDKISLDNNDVCDGKHTPRLLKAASDYLGRSLDNLGNRDGHRVYESVNRCRPYIPTEPRQIKLGHIAKVIAPHGQIVVGKIRYVGVVADKPDVHVGITSPSLIGCERAKVLCQSDRALLVPFHKLVMAWET